MLRLIILGNKAMKKTPTGNAQRRQRILIRAFSFCTVREEAFSKNMSVIDNQTNKEFVPLDSR